MQYRRARTPGGTYFFTVVTHRRQRFLCEPENVVLLKAVFRSVMAAHPFLVDAMVVLPDHIHCLWTLPADDLDFSTRWRLIKTAFTRQCGARHTSLPSAARLAKKNRLSGNSGFGNIKSGKRRISGAMWNISITIRSNMVWLRRHATGHTPRSTSMWRKVASMPIGVLPVPSTSLTRSAMNDGRTGA